ncbi:MAG: gliding motility-associated C-terminal domain-containing protein [Bacteroidetes bacterium]|nr:gliding motility-associated C-terminal domain-containing protein [Bacteroidota bacterium]
MIIRLIYILSFSLLNVLSLTAQNKNLSYIENKGQWDNNVIFKVDLKGGFLFLENNRLIYNLFDTKVVNNHGHQSSDNFEKIPEKLNWHSYSVNFLDCNPQPSISKKDSTIAYFNYFIGNDKSKWASNARGFKQVTYNTIYNGIDIVFYSDNELKYDFVIRPKSNPSQIKLEYIGADKLFIKNERLFIKTSVNTIIEEKPYAYQIINGNKIEVPCKYLLKKNVLGFEFPDGYDNNHELVIDPTLIFSAYSGSTSNNFGYTATFDSKGFLYAGSSAFGGGYPYTTGAYDTLYNGGGVDIAISKFDTSGTFLIYSTFIGGNNVELPHSLIVNSYDELFILGTTSSTNYPTTTNAIDSTFNGGTLNDLSNGLGVTYSNGSDIVVSRLSTNGDVLLASTYLGGSKNDGLNSTAAANSPLNVLKYNYADEIRGEIDIDKNNNVYVVSCTRSDDFPIIGNVFQPNFGGGDLDACIIKMDNNLQNIIWSSFLGGENHDAAFSLTIDSNEDLYVAGGTNSSSFPVTSNSLQTSFNGGRADGFITKFSKNGSQILNSSYYGSAVYDQNYFVELDKQDNVYLLGQTEIIDSTFIKNVLWGVPGSGQYISKLNADLDTLIYSTVFGSGNGINISPTTFLVDLCNKIYLAGWGGSVNQYNVYNNTGSTNGMTTTANAYQSTTDGSDFYVMVMEDDASNISYGSFFGGGISSEHVDGGTSRFDRKGKIYQSICAGCGGYSDLPIEPPNNPLNTNNHSCNLGVFKMDFDLPVVVADFDVPPIGCSPFTITLNNTSLVQSNTTFSWNFGDGDTSSLFSPTHTYNQPGTYIITLSLNDTSTCNLSDSIQKTVLILGDTSFYINNVAICPGENEQIGILPNNNPLITYSWIPSIGLSDSTISNPFASPIVTTNYTLLISNGICTDTVYQTVIVNTPLLSVTNDTILCNNQTSNLIANSFGTSNTYIWSSMNNFSDTLNNNNFSDTLNNPITLNSITPLPNVSATYYVLINNNGCLLNDSVTIKFIGSGSVSSPPPICYGDTVVLTYTNTAPGNNTQYSWSSSSQILNGNGTPTITVSPANTTTYTIIATNDICIDTITQNIIDTITQNIIVTTPQLTVSNDTVLCDSFQSIEIFANSTNPSSTIIWSSNLNFSDTLNLNFSDTISILPSVPTTYYVMSMNNGCYVVDSVFIGLSSLQTSIQNQSICIGDTISLIIQNLNPFSALTHYWQPASEIISGDSTNTILISPTTTTSYFIESENSSGCIIFDTVTVFVDTLNILPVSAYAVSPDIYIGESVQLYSSPNGYNYLWTPSIGLNNSIIQNPIATPTQTTTYTLNITGNSCSRTASLTIIVHEILCNEPDVYLPNAFTPNGDKENDVLYLRGRNVESMHLKIYDRWGELVFETDKQSVGWDGTYKGKPVDPAVFVYHLSVICIDDQEYFKKGNVTVIR